MHFFKSQWYLWNKYAECISHMKCCSWPTECAQARLCWSPHNLIWGPRVTGLFLSGPCSLEQPPQGDQIGELLMFYALRHIFFPLSYFMLASMIFFLLFLLSDATSYKVCLKHFIFDLNLPVFTLFIYFLAHFHLPFINHSFCQMFYCWLIFYLVNHFLTLF